MPKRPRVTTKAVADAFVSSSDNERIIEFGSGKTNGPGGLIQFRRMDDDTLRIHVYRTDPGVHVYAESRPHHINRAINIGHDVTLDARLAYNHDNKPYAEAGKDNVWATLHQDGTVVWRDGVRDTLPRDMQLRIVAYLAGLLGIPLPVMSTADDKPAPNVQQDPGTLTPDDIPSTFPVQPLRPGHQAEEAMTDGSCGLSWDDAIVTSYTPVPGGRCPFEVFHPDPDDDGMPATRVVQSVGDPGKWQAQYFDGEMHVWFDIGDAQVDKADADSREADYRRALNRGWPEDFEDVDPEDERDDGPVSYDRDGDPMNDHDGDV